MRWPSLRLLPLLLLTGCAGAAFEPPAPIEPVAIRIPLKSYPVADQLRLAAEIQAAPASAVWPGIVSDYSQARRAVCAVDPTSRACAEICVAEDQHPAFCSRTGAAQ